MGRRGGEHAGRWRVRSGGKGDGAAVGQAVGGGGEERGA